MVNRGFLTALPACALVLGGLVVAALPARAEPTPGAVYGFGRGSAGQLGNGGSSNSTTAAAVELPAAAGPVVDMASGLTHSLAVTSTGQLLSWGDNTDGELGRTVSGSASSDPVPGMVTLPGLMGQPTAVAAGEDFSLVVTSSGQLYSFGENNDGQLGRATSGTGASPEGTPALVTPPSGASGAVAVSAGEATGLVLTSSGQSYSFGSDSLGQAGFATASPSTGVSPTLITITGNPVLTAVSEGFSHGAVLSQGGVVYAFGDDTDGELGQPADTAAHGTPEALALPAGQGGAAQKVARLSTGERTTLVLTTAGAVYGFGEGDSGELGSGTTAQQNSTAVPITLPAGSAPVAGITALQVATFFTTSSGSVLSLGDNGYGERGKASSNTAWSTLTYPDSDTTVEGVASGSTGDVSFTIVSDLAVGTSLPAGTTGEAYTVKAPASGGIGPDNWKITGLPEGLRYNDLGDISGVPTEAGSTPVRFTVTDVDGIQATGTITLTVSDPPPATSPTPSPTATPNPVPSSTPSSTPTPTTTPTPSPSVASGPSVKAIEAAFLKSIVPTGKSALFAALSKKGYTQNLVVLERGSLTITWSYQPPKARGAKHAPKPIVVATGKASFTKTGGSHLTVKLTRAGAALLKLGHRVKLTLAGAFTPFGHRTAITATKAATLS